MRQKTRDRFMTGMKLPSNERIRGVFQENADLVVAFPTVLRKDVLAAVSALPNNPCRCSTFSVKVAGEEVSIPVRIYHHHQEMKLGWRPRVQKEILDCIFTRHSDGVVRQRRLLKIVRSRNVWIPPFVVQLAGEYVLEILQVIAQALPELDSSVYRAFLQANPFFLALTEQRIISYWDCYYRSVRREEYPGFRILEFLKSLAGKKPLSGEISTKS